jgi:folate-dependent phosphoribosylglycinamide formyltransferase PurN
MRIVVMTCSSLGLDMARALSSVPGVACVDVLISRYKVARRPFPKNVLRAYRQLGPTGMCRTMLRRLGLAPEFGDAVEANLESAIAKARQAGIEVHSVEDLNSGETVRLLQGIEPDLGIVAGTYILSPATFEAPRLGSINLHSGKAPEYRGAAPAFWELYNGERQVGITIHRVGSRLDSGPIIRQEMFALDWQPGQDPIAFIEDYRHRVLRPNGIRLMTLAVADLILDADAGLSQDEGRACLYRSPDYRDIRELRSRLAVRASVNAA